MKDIRQTTELHIQLKTFGRQQNYTFSLFGCM